MLVLTSFYGPGIIPRDSPACFHPHNNREVGPPYFTEKETGGKKLNDLLKI